MSSASLHDGLRAALAATALAGCAGGPGSSPLGAPDPPSAYLGEEPTPPGPSLDRAAFPAAAAQAFEAARRLDVPAVVALYEAMMARADGTCPNLSADETATRKTTFWYGDCTTAAGASFSGYGSLTRYIGAVTSDGATRDGADGYMNGVITDTDGARLDIGMDYLADWIDRRGGATTYLRILHGTARASGPVAHHSPWLHGERRGSLTVMITAHDDGARDAYLDGALFGLAGSVHAAAFSGLYASFSTTGPRCADPMGTLSLRQDGGGWYDLAFDAIDPHTHAVDASKCDGCGPAYFGGKPIGDACIDVTPLGSFEGAPW